MNTTHEDFTNTILSLDTDPIRTFNRTTKLSPFYMVYDRQGTSPTKTHGDFKTALTESVRLAKDNPGRQFFVLQAVTVTQSEILPVKTERLVE